MLAYGRFIANGELHEGYFKLLGRTIEFEGVKFRIESVKFLPPVIPSKIICVGLNYRDHARELGMKIPDEPVIFLKPPSAVIGHEDCIVLPRVGRVDYEGELAVVIGKRCRYVDREDAHDYILGYTCFNDVTARDLQRKDGQWTRAKSFDTFAPIGPYVSCFKDASNLRIETRLNGRVVQSSSTSNLIFDVPTLIEFISSIMTLKRGDVIATGTPAGVGELRGGDVVEVTIERIGTLRNCVVEEGREVF